MVQYSKLLTLAFLFLMCSAAMSCRSVAYLSADPATGEEILRASTGQKARVTLLSGNTIDCFSVSVRQDTTRWRMAEADTEEVAVPTDSVVAIRVVAPKTGMGVLMGASLSAIIGGVIGHASYNPPPPTKVNYDRRDPWAFLALPAVVGAEIGDGLARGAADFAATMTGIGIGLLVGGISGGALGATNETVYAHSKGYIPIESTDDNSDFASGQKHERWREAAKRARARQDSVERRTTLPAVAH